MTSFDHGRYKCLHDLLLKKYRSIMLQHIFYVLYNATYIHISVNSAVELLSRGTAQKDIICVCFKALPVKLFIHALFWRGIFCH